MSAHLIASNCGKIPITCHLNHFSAYSSVLLSICIIGQLPTRTFFILQNWNCSHSTLMPHSPSLSPWQARFYFYFYEFDHSSCKWKFTQIIRCWEKRTRTCKQGKGEKHLLPVSCQVLTVHPRMISLPKAVVLCWTSSLLWIEGPAFKVNGNLQISAQQRCKWFLSGFVVLLDC